MEKKVLKTSIPKNTLKEKYFWVEGLLIKQCFVQILKSVNRFLGGGGGGGCGVYPSYGLFNSPIFHASCSSQV